MEFIETALQTLTPAMYALILFAFGKLGRGMKNGGMKME